MAKNSSSKAKNSKLPDKEKSRGDSAAPADPAAPASAGDKEKSAERKRSAVSVILLILLIIVVLLLLVFVADKLFDIGIFGGKGTGAGKGKGSGTVLVDTGASGRAGVSVLDSADSAAQAAADAALRAARLADSLARVADSLAGLSDMVGARRAAEAAAAAARAADSLAGVADSLARLSGTDAARRAADAALRAANAARVAADAAARAVAVADSLARIASGKGGAGSVGKDGKDGKDAAARAADSLARAAGSAAKAASDAAARAARAADSLAKLADSLAKLSDFTGARRAAEAAALAARAADSLAGVADSLAGLSGTDAARRAAAAAVKAANAARAAADAAARAVAVADSLARVAEDAARAAKASADSAARVAKAAADSAARADSLSKLVSPCAKDTLLPWVTPDPSGGLHRKAVAVKLTANKKSVIEWSFDGRDWRVYDGKLINISKAATLHYRATDSCGKKMDARSKRYEFDMADRSGQCPQDMEYVKVGGKEFCVDAYEWPNRKGAVPQAYVSLYQATDSCFSQRKRLCTSDEWTSACGGPSGWKYLYGDSYEGNACAARDTAVQKSGSRPECRGYYAVFDMSGNLSEWTSTAAPQDRSFNNVMGGFWASGTQSRCADARYSYFPQNRHNPVGFRCCRDVSTQRDEPKGSGR